MACHPNSKFVNNLIAVRTEDDCRHTLLNTLYTVRYPDGSSDKQDIPTAAALATLLAETFQIDLTDLQQPLEATLVGKGLAGS